MHIRHYAPGDEHAIVRIYNHYIENATATFELEPLGVAEMLERIEKYRKAYAWFVCEVDGEVIGYAYASPFHTREGYRHTAEPSVYVAHDSKVKGVGKALYQRLLTFLDEETDCHTVMAVITMPSEASESLHESFGFKKVGHFTEVGRKFDRWIDVGYFQKHFDWPRQRGGTPSE